MYPPSSPSLSSTYYPPSPSRNSTYSDSELDQTSDGEPVYPPKATAYPAFHLPRLRPRATSIRDSDTPSLSSSTSFSSLSSVSRSHSRRSSPPTSPTSLVTPIEYQSYPQLAIIEERYAEDQDNPYRLSMESSPGSVTAITFTVPGPLVSAKTDDMHRHIPTVRTRVPHLKLNDISSARRTRSQSPSLRSPTLSSDSSCFSPTLPQTAPLTKHRLGSAVSFSRFRGGGAKGEKDTNVTSKSVQLSTKGISSGKTGNKEEIKQRQAGEKQRQKAEAKAKIEKLALELKEKARKREKAASIYSNRSGDRRPIWAEGPSMYGSLGTL